MPPTHIDLNHAGIPLASLALALRERTSNQSALRFSGVASPEARRAVKQWLSDLAELPDVPGLTTHDKVLLEVVRALFRPDLIEAWETAVERRRLARLEGERLEAERAVGAARIAAAKAEREREAAERAERQRRQQQAEAERLERAAASARARQEAANLEAARKSARENAWRVAEGLRGLI